MRVVSSGSELWRTAGVGGTDVAAILGCDADSRRTRLMVTRAR